jgi:CRP-like cAMP-binding protein
LNITIPRDLAARVVWFCSHRNVRTGETVIDKNSPGRDIYIISRGSFRVHDDTAGDDFVLAVLERGDIFGEMSFLDGAPRSASVSANCNGSLLKMGETEFAAMLKKEPEIAVQFLRFLSGVVCSRLRLANCALHQAAFGDSETSLEIDSHLREAIAQMHAAVRIELEGS